MLRLTYRTGVFGPLRFEYTKRRVRVGSCRDNDLVLPHPSIQPYHCTLAFEEDWLAVLQPNAPEDSPVEGTRWLGPGDRLELGELVLEIERSPNSVGLPSTAAPVEPGDRTPEGYWIAKAPVIPETARWLCGTCDLRFEDAQVRVIGLAGRRRHALCPVCSHHVAFVRMNPSAGLSFTAKARNGWKKFLRALGF